MNKLKDLIICCIVLTVSIFFISPVYSKSKNQSSKVEPKSKETPIKKTEVTEKLENEKLPPDSDKETSDIVIIQTEKGVIKIKLFTKETPITTNNFIDLVKKGFYNGTVFHRVVENFVIQGGDPLGDGTGDYVDSENGKSRFIKLERSPNLKFDRAGRVGMARTSDPNSASCQFFIALQPLPSLDPGGSDPYGYAIFGQVTDDTFETVKKIVQDFKPAYPGSDKPSHPVRMNLVTLK